MFASAGTGKTWLLTARILRLLLQGESPNSILVLTFTRKAAAEIRQRLVENLSEWVRADDKSLAAILRQYGVENPTARQMEAARNLYEEVQFTDRPVRTATFDSFFQDLLRRFPLEAGIPVNFHIVSEEQADLLQQEAQEQLLQQTSRDPELQKSLRYLRLYLVDPYTLRKALRNFLSRSLEWRIYQGNRTPKEMYAELREIFRISEREKCPMFSEHADELSLFAQLLEKTALSKRAPIWKTAAKLRKLHQEVTKTRGPETSDPDPHGIGHWFEWQSILFRDEQMKSSIEQISKAGDQRLTEKGESQAYKRLVRYFQKLYSTAFVDARSRHNLETNLHYYRVCLHLLDLYQRIKYRSGKVDFDDLSWSALQLMQNNNSEWIQYKLSQRIRHILVDEFQDTDNLSWQVLQSFLEGFRELSPGAGTHSTFIVGDTKQSIYQWRRANPEIQQEAGQYLQQYLNAEGPTLLSTSWRSCPAVIGFVNAYFLGRDILKDFRPHKTHRQKLWGQVELLPLLESPEKEPAEQFKELRDPLTEARQTEAPSLISRQAEQIADRIGALVESGFPIQDGDTVRPARWDDVLILVRARTHLEQIEKALTNQRIPFARQSRETLLNHLEVLDMLALLQVLIDPADDLHLAQVLRSPLYCATDEHLLELARSGTSRYPWYNRLQDLAQQKPGHPLAHVAAQLESWRQYLDHVPTHDLLDRVFFEADVLRRYREAWPEKDAGQAVSNLVYFLELALEHNQGRYPSTHAFVHHINQMRSGKIQRPDTPSLMFAPQETQYGRVNILTVHAAKGLEAPIVVYASLEAMQRRGQVGDTLVEWQTREQRPQKFLMRLRPEHQNRTYQDLIAAQWEEKQAEAHHIDYVAFTRAKQILILCVHKNQYETALQALHGAGAEKPGEDDILRIQTPPPKSQSVATLPTHEQSSPDGVADLGRPPLEEVGERYRMIHYSDPDALQTGQRMHRILELLGGDEPGAAARERVAAEMKFDPSDPIFATAWEEASACVQDEALSGIFHPDAETRVYREVPLTRLDGEQQEFGIIDLLLVGPDRVRIIDFKTHRAGEPGDLARRHREQMERYARCAQAIYPERSVECSLLLTASRTLLRVVPAGDGSSVGQGSQ